MTIKHEWPVNGTGIEPDIKGGLDATVIGSPVIATGLIGNAYDLTNVNQALVVADNVALRPNTGPFALTGFFGFPSATSAARQFLISKWDEAGDRRSFAVFREASGAPAGEQNRVAFAVSADGVAETVIFGPELADNRIYFIAALYDAPELLLYVNCHKVAHALGPSSIYSGAGADFVIGNTHAQNQGADGFRIDRTRFYNTNRLTPGAMILDLRDGYPLSCQHHWDMDDLGTPAVEADHIGSADGTQVGSVGYGLGVAGEGRAPASDVGSNGLDMGLPAAMAVTTEPWSLEFDIVAPLATPSANMRYLVARYEEVPAVYNFRAVILPSGHGTHPNCLYFEVFDAGNSQVAELYGPSIFTVVGSANVVITGHVPDLRLYVDNVLWDQDTYPGLRGHMPNLSICSNADAEGESVGVYVDKVKFYRGALVAEEISYTHYDNDADADFHALNPDDGDTGVAVGQAATGTIGALTTTRTTERDQSPEDVDETTLVVSVDKGAGEEVVWDFYGGDQNGYSVSVIETLIQGRLAYNYEVTPPGGAWPASQVITVRGQCENALTTVMDTTYSFTTGADVQGPYLDNQNPPSFQTGVDNETDVYLEIVDAASDVDETTVIIDIRKESGGAFTRAYDYATGFQNGYGGSVVEDTTPGGYKYYKVTLEPPVGEFTTLNTVTVTAQADDSEANSMNESYDFIIEGANPFKTFWTFDTVDVTPPYVDTNTPTGVDVAADTDISFHVKDAGVGVDLTTVVVTIEGTTAYDGGAGGFQPGFAGSVAGSSDDYTITINPDSDFGSYQVVDVDVDASDLATVPNVMSTFSWSFTTEDSEAPAVTNNAPTGIDNPITSLVEFDISDAGSGVDLTTLVVTIEGSTAYDGSAGGFQAGYQGVGSAVTGTPASYHVAVDADPDYVQWTTIDVDVDAADIDGNVMSTFSWSFDTADTTAPIVSNESPTGIDVAVDEDVTFDVTDPSGSGVDLATLDVNIHGTAAVVDGVAQGGYSLATVPIANGHHVTVGHPNLPSFTAVTIEVYAEDVKGNGITPIHSWSYTTADVLGPQVSNNAPTGTGVNVQEDVQFDITDVGAGVDVSSIVVTIEGDTAYAAGAFQSGYDGLLSAVSIIAGGYHFRIDKTAAYPGLTTIDVDIDAQDLATVPNVMPTFSWSFETEFVDLIPPVISLRDPAPGDTDVALDKVISFRVTDADSGVVLGTLDAFIDSTPMVLGGVPQTGYSAVITPVTNGYDVAITPDDDLDYDRVYGLTVNASDPYTNTLHSTWQFTTTVGLIVSPQLRATALSEQVNLSWTVPPSELMLQVLYQLRRSTTAYPALPNEGTLIYQGLQKTYVDTDVENGRLYYYTIFVVRRYIGGVPDYVPYDTDASASARPRDVATSTLPATEYVPARGDFGPRTVDPMPYGRTLSVYGSYSGSGRRYSDIVSVTPGRAVRSPVRGTVRDVYNASSAGGRVTKAIEIEVDSGLIVILSGIIVSVSKRSTVEAGQVIGKTVGGTVEFSAYKGASGGRGKRSVRPRYFYLTIENRDGR